MLEKIKERIQQWFRTGEEVFRSKFESEHETARITRSEDGTYVDPAIEAEWQKELAIFKEEVDISMLR
ncbi:hypothetical protein [Pseudomonas khavaziana]|uniref:hypothetical protein n=1 Tax=Pseudomonas khavaziana TaxID=2842351 RepID=UPI001C3E8053|nr:hypothetical protein [Pseudomonas khavaziana]MBV4480507.1 hypothetical protein [Pseudomonas khavaziana]